MVRGKVIEFEGLDGSFKETNAKRLYEHLKEKGYNVNIVSFPRYECNSSFFVKKFLTGAYGVQDGVNPMIINKFYALDRYDYVETFNVRKRIENGEWFIFDRYVGSSLLYQSANSINKTTRERAQNLMFNFEYEVLNLPKPNLVIAMKSNFEMTVKSLEKKDKKDAIERNLTYLKKINEIYDDLIKKYSWCPIDILTEDETEFRNKDDVFNDILDLIDKKLIPKQIEYINRTVNTDIIIKNAVSKCKYVDQYFKSASRMISETGFCKGIDIESSCNSCIFCEKNQVFKPKDM